MTFSEKLNDYLSEFGLSYSRLAKISGMSASAVSRYKNGEREPAYDSEQMKKIAYGLYCCAREKGFDISEDEILTSLQRTVKDNLKIDYETYVANLNTLLSAMGIRVITLAKALSFDPSHISKILSGRRRPGNLTKFTADVGAFVSRKCTSEQELAVIAGLIKCGGDELSGQRAVSAAIVKWLGSNMAVNDNSPIANFLEKMDAFNLDDFIRTIRFDDIKLPTVPFQLPTTKTYSGINEMMESELDFIKATVLSKSMDDCILYSDMPLEEMARDPQFPKKWMFGRAMMLKKGLRLKIIHDVNRPFNEMMLGLEGHIPMYMTGQISPYYLPSSQNAVFTHLLNVSGAAALEGHAISGYQGSGRYVLYKSKEDVKHFRIRAEQLLKKANPLMDIYRSDRKSEFAAQMKKLWREGGRRVVYCSLPIYTISNELLDSILLRAKISKDDARQIKKYRNDCRADAERLFAESDVTLVLPDLSERQFGASPLNLALSELFVEADVPYTYREYSEHLKQTKEFAERFCRLNIEFDSAPTFKNISYTVVGGKCVVVSKNKYPTIHFVIHHKKMVQAFRDFIPPIREEG